MNKRINVFLLGISVFAMETMSGMNNDYSDLAKSPRKKKTSISHLYDKVVGDYRQGAIANEKLKNDPSCKDDGDVRLKPMTTEERLFVGVAGIVDQTFEGLESQDIGSFQLEAPEEKDIESPLSSKAYEELRLVSPNGRGFVYSVKPSTRAGTGVLLRLLIDNHVSPGDIEAKQALQKEFINNQEFRHSVQSQIDKIVKGKVEKKIVDSFVSCTRNKEADSSEVLSSVDQIQEYADIVHAIHVYLSKDKKFDGKKILFTRYLDIRSHELFKKFQVLLEEYNKEKSSWQMSHPKTKALEAFLRSGKLFTEVLFPAMTAYGVCDLFLTTTRQLSPGGQNSEFNYAKVVASDVPFVKALNISHPNFHGRVPVSFEFKRKENAVGIVMTGQNGSGKSFGLKQFLANLALAQAYGIVRGSLEFTPFDAIDLHANVSDTDTASKYTNEVELFKNLVDRIKRLPKDKKSMVLFDEAFVSTGSREAFQLLATSARFLMQNSNVIAMYVTHSQELADIAELEPWRTKVTKNIDGTYTSLFSLEQGTSKENNALIAMYKACGPIFKELRDKHFSDKVDSLLQKQSSVNDDGLAKRSAPIEA